MVVIWNPLQAQIIFSRLRIITTLIVIFIIGLVVNIHYFYTFQVQKKSACNGTITIYDVTLTGESLDPVGYAFGQWAIMLKVIFTQLLPLLSLAVLDGYLLFYLIYFKTRYVTLLQSLPVRHRQKERQLLIVIVVIITSFVLFNIPSAVIHTIHFASGLKSRMPNEFFIAAEISNIMIVTGKALKIVWYSMCSKSFRWKLLFLWRKLFSKQPTTNA